MWGYSPGFLREGASNDSGVVDDDIFGYFGGYVFGNFREKGQHCMLSADNDQQESPAVVGNRTMLL